MFDKRLLAFVPGAKRFIAGNVALSIIALLANVVVMMALGVFLQTMMCSVQGGSTSSSLSGGLTSSACALADLRLSPVALLAIAAACIIVRMLCNVGAQRLGTEASSLAKRTIRTALFDKLLKLGPDYLEHVSTAEATQISVEGVEQLEVYFGAYLPQFFYAMAAPIVLFVCLLPLSLPAAVVLLVCVPLIPASIVAFQKVAKRLMKGYWGSYTDLGGMFLENIQGLTTLKVYQADAARHEEMNEAAEGFRQATMRVLRMQLNSVTIMDVLAYGGAAIGIVVVLSQFLAGSVSFAAAFAIIFLSADFFLPMRRLGSLFHTAMNGMAAADRMFALLEVSEPEGRTERIEGGPGTVTLRGVGYSYDGERQVLEEVDFEASEGRFVGIVGESGSGKSTLAGILSGRNSQFTGSVEISGKDAHTIDRASLARCITTVGYESHLFRGTLRENLAMAVDPKDDEDVASVERKMWDALQRAQIADFVRVNGGLDMPIAEGSSNISGGQRQRISIARALLHDTPIYIFDEVTSSIDPASEAAVLEAVLQLAASGKTVIMISHRLSNVRTADVIYVLEDGHVCERGTHEELLAAAGTYANMVEQQRVLEEIAQTRAEVPILDADVAAHSRGEAGESASSESLDGEGAYGGRRTENEEVASSRLVDSATIDARAANGEKARLSNQSASSRSGLRIMGRMIGLVRPLAGYMVLAVLLGIVGFLCAFAVTVIGAGALAHWSAGATTSFWPIALLAIVVAVVRGPLHYGEQICNHYIAFRLLALIRDRVFATLRRLAPAKLEGRERGNLISIVTSDIELLEVFYAHTISPVIIAVVTCVVMLVAIAAQSIMLALVALVAYLVVGVVVPFVSSRASAGLGDRSRAAAGSMNSMVLENLRNLPETVQFGQEASRREQLLDEMETMRGIEKLMKARSSWSQAITGALVLVFDIASALVASSLANAGQVEPAAACLGLALLMSSYGPVIATANLGTTLQNTLASGARVLDILDEKPETLDVGEDGVTIDGIAPLGAEVCDVDFSYGAEKVLRNVNVAIRPGTIVRIAGKSGSGKSTLCKLLMRFWDVGSGKIEIAGHDIRKVQTRSLRTVQSYMTQSTHLFCGTLEENIRLAKPDATDEQLRDACESAALGDLIARLPQGLQTPVGELGSTLSGGERQRIGLARVFLHDAPFVLLDEPTSNLDALNEAAVLHAIRNACAGRTIVLVSHRDSTASLADSTIIIERGRIS